MRIFSRHSTAVVGAALAVLALAGCGSSVGLTGVGGGMGSGSGESASAGSGWSTSSNSGSASSMSGASTSSSSSGSGSMAGMDMGGSSTAATTVPSVNGIKPVPIRTLATSYWQDMEVQAQTMTPVPFVIFTGSRKEQEIKPPKGSSFHLMIMLTDRYTHYQIPYASVWATIVNSKGKVLFNERQWPMISEYMGSHYGNNVPHLAAGRYTLRLLISPPVSARHMEYAKIWQSPHTIVQHFTWKPAT